MNLHALALSRIERGDGPVRVGLIGAGKFGSMFLNQVPTSPLEVTAIADLSPDRARAACQNVGWENERINATAFLEDGRELAARDDVDVVLEVTGSPPAGIAHSRAAFANGKHIVMVNVEADVLAGPLLAREAQSAGVVYSMAYGDQPALVCEIVDWARAAGFDPRTQYHVGHLVLIAPDMDVDVSTQRIIAEGLGRSVEHVTIYVSEEDWAIGLAQSLFSSKRRVGQMNPDDFTEEQKRLIREVGNVDIIFYKGTGGGSFGHSYYESPEVLSDLFMLGEGHKAGAEHGRPLEPIAPRMWMINDGYAP